MAKVARVGDREIDACQMLAQILDRLNGVLENVAI